MKKNNRTQDLISQLVQESSGKRIHSFSPGRYTLLTLLLITFTGIFLLNLKYPLNFHFLNDHQSGLMESLSLSLIFIFISTIILLNFINIIPSKNVVFIKPMTWTLFFLIILTLFSSSFLIGSIHHPIRPWCELESFLVAVFSTSSLHVILKKFEYLKVHQRFSFFSLHLAVPFIATFIMHATCNLELIHMLSCHIVPVMIPSSLYLYVQTKTSK